MLALLVMSLVVGLVMGILGVPRDFWNEGNDDLLPLKIRLSMGLFLGFTVWAGLMLMGILWIALL